MQFLQANQRRRRVLADDLSAADDANRPAVSLPSRTHRRIDGYAPGAKPEQQRRVIDLVPSSPLSFGLWFAAGLAAIGGLTAGQIWLPAIAARISAQAAASLELGARGSLSGWVASLWLGLAGAISLLIYSIRRHKLDDYRGRYRWWLFGAAAWFVMSVDATCGIHQLFSATMIHLTGYTGLGGGVLWWIGCWGIVLCGLSARIAWEMRVCRPAMSAYLSALALWICGLVIQMTGVKCGSLGNLLPTEIAKLLGHLSLLLGLAIYARHVILHAQGLLPARKRKANKEKPARDGKSAAAVGAYGNDDAVATETPASSPTPAKTRTDLHPHVALSPARPAPVDDEDTGRDEESSANETDDSRYGNDDADTDENGGQNRKLSKAERKRLRKLKAQEEQGW
jgi:hypothetical protein